MELYKSILTLIKRFFFGTPESEVNVNNYHIKCMEAKYLRNELLQKNRQLKKMELEIKYANLNK